MVPRNLNFRFTLVSYNILSQNLLNYHQKLYTDCNPLDLEWPKRGHRILSKLIDNQADIICLQEVQYDHLKTLFQPGLAKCGYKFVYKQKTGYRSDGCAIFYNSHLIRLSHYEGIEFNRRDIDHLLDRDNVGIIAVFEPKKHYLSSLRFVVANTHLLFNPKRSDKRLAQLKFFLRELERVSSYYSEADATESDGSHSERHHNHYPTIICGDFNSSPDSIPLDFILGNISAQQVHDCFRECESATETACDNDRYNQPQSLEEDFIQEQSDLELQPKRSSEQTRRSDDSLLIDNSIIMTTEPCRLLEFRSVHPSHNSNQKSYASSISGKLVDHILYTPGRLHLESYSELLTEDELIGVGPIPNQDFPSDHLPLKARFTLS